MLDFLLLWRQVPEIIIYYLCVQMYLHIPLGGYTYVW